MKRHYYYLVGLALFTTTLSGQDYLTPTNGYKSEPVFPGHTSFGPFDIGDSVLYASNGDTIRAINLITGLEIAYYSKPAGYEAYSSFITLSPDGKKIWAGYTVFGNTDDRIYRIDINSGVWELKAVMPANFDLVFWNDSLLVSGTNSTNWLDPASIFLLDTSGLGNHRKIVNIGGYSAGLALDTEGDLYYGTSLATDTNALYKWDSTDIAQILQSADSDTLVPEDAIKLSDLPSGAYDCAIDAAGNLVFNLNNFAGDKVVALWNGAEGDGFNYDTLSVATGDYDWLGMIKTQGNINIPEEGNRVITISIGTPLLDVHRDYLPKLNNPVHDFWVYKNASDTVINLEGVFTDSDDPDSTITIHVKSNNNEALVNTNVLGKDILLSFKEGSVGEAEIVVEGISGGEAISDSFQIAVKSAVGIKGNSIQDMEIFPNPSNGIFMVRTRSVDPVTLSIHRMNGSLVYKTSHYLSENRIDISKFPADSYIVRGKNSTGSVSRIIQKH